MMPAAPLFDMQVLASGSLADLALAAQQPDAALAAGPATQMLFLNARYHSDPRMPLLQHHLNALGHRGAVHSLRVESDLALGDAMVFLRALLSQADRILVVQDGLDLPLAAFSQGAPGSYLLIAAAVRPPDDETAR
ncbi:hypothetical protein KM031_18435 (plasmid) [Gemmobacter fulvus]|uniref:Uncharacterized protein n=1 Tax=Gemmobacter fulvus TaxID=2840474 RepID=A0A975PAP4_9RHOB|nr:hypothetical protein [Gemmobacter fulvus]MBT9245959.1 hypothetical protein [Gemmobacter fulvus]QWK92268.1 hypothetical protein KM031_18435 [Gemmobacter fulvus]